MPVNVGEAIGRLILELEKGKISADLPYFKYSRYLKTSDQEFINDFLIRSKKFSKEKVKNQLSLFS